MKKSWLISLTIVCTILGLLLSWQYKSFRHESSSSPNILKENLISMIEGLETQIESLEEEIGNIRNALSTYHETEELEIDKLDSLKKLLQHQRMISAQISAQGPGLVITLDDNVSGAQNASSDFLAFNPADYIIHDKTLLYLVNELRAAGAKAISINNQRIVTNSDIRCVGTVILVNTIPMAPPYTIKILGEPKTIEEQLSAGTEIPFLRSQNFPVKMEVSNVEIPEYKGSFRNNYLKPMGEDI